MNIFEEFILVQEETEHIRRVATSLVQVDSSISLQELIVEECTRALKVDAVCLHLLQGDGQYLMVAERGCTPQFKAAYRIIPKHIVPLISKTENPHETLFIGTPQDFLKEVPSSKDILETTLRRLVCYAPLVVNLNPIGILGFSYNRDDVTVRREFVLTLVNLMAQALERVRLFERERQARQEAEEASRAKSNFLANVSHEIRTPITAIQGFSGLLCASSSLGPEEGVWASRILKNTQHLMGLIGDILDISKIEAKAIEVNPSPFIINDLVEDVSAVTAFKAQEKSLKLLFNTSHPRAEIFSDPAHIRQILINLTSNAIKFTSKGEVRVSVELSDSLMRIIVKDTGVGIPEKDQGQIFDPFTQAGNTIGKFGGTGLGLCISKRLTEALGGDLVLVESEPQVGSTFKLELPCRIIFKNENKVKKPKQNLAERLKGYKVLLVDDSYDNRYLLHHVLSVAGALVDVAEDGQSGVSKAISRDYDIVVMDIQMPNLDGNAAAKELRSRHYTKPLVALTASALTSEREFSYRCGFNEYLTKPIDFEQLITTIKSLA